MSTKSFLANALNAFAGTLPDALTGTMSVLMLRSVYYTDRTLLQKGTTQTVTKAWARDMCDRQYCKDLSGIFPVSDTPILSNGNGGSGTLTNTGSQVYSNASPYFYVPLGLGEFEQRLSIAGAVLNGSAPDGAAIQTATNAMTPVSATARPKFAKFPDGGLSAVLEQGLTVNATQLGIDFNGMAFTAQAGLTGYMLSAVGTSGGTHFGVDSPITWEGGTFIGLGTSAGNDAGTCDGLGLGGTTNPGRLRLQNMEFRNHRIAYAGLNNCYMVTADHCRFVGFQQYGFAALGTSNAGENVGFCNQTLFGDGRNSTGTAIAIYTPVNSNFDLKFAQVSFDYCDQFFLHNAGLIALMDCHLENNENNPMGVIRYSGGNAATKFSMITGAIQQNGPSGSGAGGAEASDGRNVIFSVTPDTGDRLVISGHSIEWASFGRQNTKLVDYTGAGNISVSFNAVNGEPQGNQNPLVSPRTNMLSNPSFESGATLGWTTSVSTGTFSADTGTFCTLPATGNGLGAPITGAVGSGYTNATVNVTYPSGGSGLVIVPNIVSGQITSYTKTSDAYGCLVAPTLAVAGNGTGATVTIQRLNKQSLKLIGAGGTDLLSQVLPGINPGLKLWLRGFVSCEARTGGTVVFNLYWLRQDSSVLQTINVAALTGTATFAQFSNNYAVPSGAVYAKIEIGGTGFTGTAHFDEFSAELI